MYLWCFAKYRIIDKFWVPNLVSINIKQSEDYKVCIPNFMDEKRPFVLTGAYSTELEVFRSLRLSLLFFRLREC